MEIQNLKNKNVEIEELQTTFIKIKVDGKTIRYNLINRQESRLKKEKNGILKFYDKHPLLYHYSEKKIEIFINSSPTETEKFINELKETIEKSFLGFRTWEKLIIDNGINFTMKTFIKNVEDGSGKLFIIPKCLEESVNKVCFKYEVRTKTFEISSNPRNFKLITIGDNYIIASDFIES